MPPSALMVLVLSVYIIIWTKFRKIKKQLENMKKENEETYEPPQVQFTQNFGLFTKMVNEKAPSLNTDEIKVLSIKLPTQLDYSDQVCFTVEQDFRRTRKVSIVKRLYKIGGDLKSVSYILVIVGLYVLTWLPLFTFYLHEGFSEDHQMKFSKVR